LREQAAIQPASTSPVPPVASRALPVGLMAGTWAGAAITVPDPFSTTTQPNLVGQRARGQPVGLHVAGRPAQQPRRFQRMRREHRRRRIGLPRAQQRLQLRRRRPRRSAHRRRAPASRASCSTRGSTFSTACRRRSRRRPPARQRRAKSRGSHHQLRQPATTDGAAGIERREEDAAGAGMQGRAGGELRGAQHARRAADDGDVAVAALVRSVQARARRRAPASTAHGASAGAHAQVVEPDLAGGIAAATGEQAGLEREQASVCVARTDSPAPVSAFRPLGTSTASTGPRPRDASPRPRAPCLAGAGCRRCRAARRCTGPSPAGSVASASPPAQRCQERLRRPAAGRVAGQVTTTCLAPLRQVQGGFESVAAVVARPAGDPDVPRVRRDGERQACGGQAGPLHQRVRRQGEASRACSMRRVAATSNRGQGRSVVTFCMRRLCGR
jgi:hypothetical protein